MASEAALYRSKKEGRWLFCVPWEAKHEAFKTDAEVEDRIDPTSVVVRCNSNQRAVPLVSDEEVSTSEWKCARARWPEDRLKNLPTMRLRALEQSDEGGLVVQRSAFRWAALALELKFSTSKQQEWVSQHAKAWEQAQQVRLYSIFRSALTTKAHRKCLPVAGVPRWFRDKGQPG